MTLHPSRPHQGTCRDAGERLALQALGPKALAAPAIRQGSIEGLRPTPISPEWLVGCLIPGFDDASLSSESKDALWAMLARGCCDGRASLVEAPDLPIWLGAAVAEAGACESGPLTSKRRVADAAALAK